MEKLSNYYSTDECSDKDKLYSKLKTLSDEGKIEYKKEDIDIIKIEDIELEDSELNELVKFLDNLDVFPYNEYNDVDEEYDEEYDDDDDDYTTKKYKRDDEDYDF